MRCSINRGSNVHLRSIALRNWKSYRRVIIDLPADAAGRNVYIIEGNNGAGKTSLLEAMTLCLFGRSGLDLVARASSASRPDQSYDGFLERALNAGSRGQAARMSITLEFDGSRGPVAIERAWHFSASGRHRREDEEVRLFEGPDLDLVPLPELDEGDFLRDFVTQRLISRNLAGFFLLDGEHLERMAGQGVDTQVREAVEAVLGAPALRGLAADLRAYARDRRRQLPQGTDTRIGAATEELAALEIDEHNALERVESLVVGLGPLRRTRDEVVRRIGSLHGDSYHSFKALFEDREQVVRSRDSQRDELRSLLSGDLALALAGPTLRKRVLTRIEAEERAERWESGSNASRGRFEEFLGALRSKQPVEESEIDTLRSAWDEVWSARPEDCATEIRFLHLGETDRRSVTEHLDRLSSVRSENIADLSRAVAAHDRRIQEIEREIGRQRGNDGESQALADELTAIQEKIAQSEAQHRQAVDELDRVRTLLSERRSEVAELLASSELAAPLIDRAGRAERFADLAERLIEAALPANLDGLSEAVTLAYRAMAHKSVVERVRIQPNGAVQLLDGAGGDLRRVDASAGESQIFALALMSALAELAGDFPIVMDMPLARLDPLHRRNVLNRFATGDRQLILLTHPAEIGPDEFAILEPRVAHTVTIGLPSPAAAIAGAA